jgi:hypothetical protein
VPVLAARLADIVVVDPDPLVGGRVRGHPLDQLAVLLLDVGGVVEAAVHVLDAGGEAVAHPLELVDRQEPRAAQAGNAELDPLARERRAEEPGERQLHRRDLASQVGARGALVVLVEDGVEALRRRRRKERVLRDGLNLGNLGPFEQRLWHQGLSPLNGSRWRAPSHQHPAV